MVRQTVWTAGQQKRQTLTSSSFLPPAQARLRYGFDAPALAPNYWRTNLLEP